MCFLLITLRLKKTKTKKQNKTKTKKQNKTKQKTKNQLKKTAHETMNFGSSNLTKPKKKSKNTINVTFSQYLYFQLWQILFIFLLFYFILS